MEHDSKNPKEFQAVHDALYKKIKAMVGGETINLRNDPTIIRILLESAMVIVEKFRDENGKGYTGPEKKRIVIMVTKWVITDLGNEGVIDVELAKEINANIEFFGGVAVDLAVAGAKNLFDVGQQMIADDVARGGCCASICL